ncbi:unnamed protein product [Effrenium voratum]|nr:unnamed protein product [Effrenium voratum]
MPVVTREEFFRCVTKTVHLVAAELRRKLQQVNNKLLPRRPPERGSPESHKDRSGPTPKTPGRHSSPWAAMAELSGSDVESPASSPRSRSEAESGEEALPKQEAVPRSQEAVFKPAPEEAAPTPVLFRPAPEEKLSVNGMIVLVLSSEGSFEPQVLALEVGTLHLSSVESGGISSFFTGRDGSAFDLSMLEMLVRGAAVARSPAAQMIPGVVWKSPESIARTLVLFFENSALCLWFQETEHCTFCCKAFLEEARAYGADPRCEGL